jgi:hypothetical protein
VMYCCAIFLLSRVDNLFNRMAHTMLTTLSQSGLSLAAWPGCHSRRGSLAAILAHPLQPMH